MQRREYLQATATVPFLGVSLNQVQSQAVEADVTEIISEFFRSLPDSEQERTEEIRDCAGKLCQAKQKFLVAPVNEILAAGSATQQALRRTRYGLEILSEHKFELAVSGQTVESVYNRVSQVTRFIPILGSFNNVLKKACAVTKSRPKSIEKFLYAVLAFAIEVGLFIISAPYQVAWRGTRFIANRTLLRVSSHLGDRTVALAMSELHWVIRGTIHGELVSDDAAEYTSEQLSDFKSWATEHGELDISIETGKEEILQYDFIESGEQSTSSDGWFDLSDWLPEIDVKVELPELEDFFGVF